jgi:serine/threonine protein kinase
MDAVIEGEGFQASGPASLPDGLERGTLSAGLEKTLRRGGLGNPDVVLVRTSEGFVVVKDFAPRPFWVRETLGRWLTRHEQKVYRALDGIDLVPRLLGAIDRYAFVMEYRPGRLLSRSLKQELPADFLAELERGVSEMHHRGIVHLDLSHRSNVLLGEDGRPVLLDFASAIRFGSGSVLGRALTRGLARVDLRALRKWRTKLGSGSST